MEDNTLVFQGTEYKAKRINLDVRNKAVELFATLKLIDNPMLVKEVREAIQTRRKEFKKTIEDIRAENYPADMESHFINEESNIYIADEIEIKINWITTQDNTELYKKIIENFVEDCRIDLEDSNLDFVELKNFVIDVLSHFKKKIMLRIT